MDHFTIPPNADSNALGDFVEIAAVDSLRGSQDILLRTKDEFKATLRILQNREQLTVATILNLADSIGRQICEPSLGGPRYQIECQAIKPCPDGQLVRTRDAEGMRDACRSLFDECEALQDAIRSELHRIHNEYVFVRRGGSSADN